MLCSVDVAVIIFGTPDVFTGGLTSLTRKMPYALFLSHVPRRCLTRLLVVRNDDRRQRSVPDTTSNCTSIVRQMSTAWCRDTSMYVPCFSHSAVADHHCPLLLASVLPFSHRALAVDGLLQMHPLMCHQSSPINYDFECPTCRVSPICDSRCLFLDCD